MQTQATTPFGAARGANALREYWLLTKPRITAMVVITAAGGMWLAPARPSVVAVAVALGSLAMVVGCANALNCWLERDLDRLMARTANRPLPAARLAPRPALVFAVTMGLVSVPMLALLVNPLTGALGALSLLVYVGLYTPLKKITPGALFIGALPGAMPPLMGWTAATGHIAWPGVVLFGLLLLWQLPHFIAISVSREEEYTRAGLSVLPAVLGRRAAHRHAMVWAALLVPVSLSLGPMGVAGPVYMCVALGAGLVQCALFAWGLRPACGDRGARLAFLASIVYLPVVFTALLAGL